MDKVIIFTRQPYPLFFRPRFFATSFVEKYSLHLLKFLKLFVYSVIMKLASSTSKGIKLTAKFVFYIKFFCILYFKRHFGNVFGTLRLFHGKEGSEVISHLEWFRVIACLRSHDTE